ncbi:MULTISPECIES: hypothetical protein [Mycobacterium]|uniref:Uncharacterized protein n=1 Tax=Mycobacterium kiyosense TaxID=2871094 RepID=A0A9P3QE44_9MYCO|nr:MULTISPECIES: hypothetical protein [Mycobacterium]BDB41757.1 hypothetical protein IWGMT90018_22030 [Mycobacterium kiyosense]BDE14951.1 hypothetical protein MKCMC460_38110 [Mycobacterium sp. 20KCMC460]GLB82320.1 hypothetical protein SRL2020028_15760 [Mycobacterium kiyosense]GLB89368.1 hypothetical protein SRL2020130_21850 [Mycobacterium kiyosense]GLB98925.1 hypothetical protein SRL2020226_57010 [Mycobacterium kiyosense]
MSTYPAFATVRFNGVLANHLESLEVMIDELRRNGVDGEIAYRPSGGKGPGVVEVIGIYIALKAADATISTVTSTTVTAVMNWIKNPFKRASAEISDQPVTKDVTIYGPDDKPLKRIKGSSADDIEVTDPDDAASP